MNEPGTLEEFRAVLARSGEDFIYTGEPSDDCTGIRFLGTFQGAEVIWDATIMTLPRYNARQAQANKPATQRQFIDIARTGDTMRRIVIGLGLQKLDRPALLKTMIMVRKYKRLHIGRHEFVRRSRIILPAHTAIIRALYTGQGAADALLYIHRYRT